jgi:hypothetical protein
MKIPDYVVRSISSRILQGLKDKKTSGILLLNSHCPLCSDTRSRFYIKDYGTTHRVYCHNCGYSRTFYNFLKDYYPNEVYSLKTVFMNSLKDGSVFKQNKISKEEKLSKILDSTKKLSDTIYSYCLMNGFHITEKQEDEKNEEFRIKCIKYLVSRHIPKEIMKDFFCFTKRKLNGYVGIPFFDKNKEKYIHIQGRMVRDATDWEVKNKTIRKYCFLKDIDDDNIFKIDIENKPFWGTWRVDLKKDVIICEGTLDACAFENGVSLAGATISESTIKKVKNVFPKRIWCFDSYWFDKKGREMIEKMLKSGERCFIIPKDSKCKDANELLPQLETKYIDVNYILHNTIHGLEGLLKLKTQSLLELRV